MSRKPLLGDQQLDVLRFISDNAPLSVSEVAKRYGEPRGLARTTLLTVMETLRKKGYLVRAKEDGVYRYAPRIEAAEVTKGLVRDFVERTLGGSATPFVAYLEESGDLSREEIERLRAIVERLDGDSEEDAP